MEEHQPHVGACYKAADMGIGWCVVINDFQTHVGLQPLYLLDNVERSMNDELIHVS